MTSNKRAEGIAGSVAVRSPMGARLLAVPRLPALARRLTATPAIPAALAVFLGLFRAGEKSIWLDEAFSIAVARLPTLEMLNFLWRIELHGAPYHLVLHPWLALGQAEVVVRSLSVVFGVVAVLATWSIGRRYGVAFPAALLLAVMPAFVQYEQEARAYTLYIATAAVATLLFLRLIERPGRWRAALYVVVGAGMIYVQPLGALVIVAHALAVPLFAAPGTRRRLLLVYLPIVVAWLPMIRFALLNRDRISWIPPTTVELVTGELLIVGGGLVVSLLLLALVLLGARRDPLTLWLVIPVIGIIAVSLLVQPTVQARYFLGILPAAALIAARNHRLLVTGLLAASLVGAWNWYENAAAKDDWRGAAAWVATEAGQDDGIVFAPGYLRTAFAYHARPGTPLNPDQPWGQSDLLGEPADEAAIRAHPRIWLVEGHVVALPDHVATALAGYRAVEQRDFTGPHGLRVTLLVNGQATGP